MYQDKLLARHISAEHSATQGSYVVSGRWNKGLIEHEFTVSGDASHLCYSLVVVTQHKTRIITEELGLREEEARELT